MATYNILNSDNTVSQSREFASNSEIDEYITGSRARGINCFKYDIYNDDRDIFEWYGVDRGPRTVPSIAGHARTQRVESHTAMFYDSNQTSSRVKHRPARYETKVGTPISSRCRGKHRAQRRLQLWCLEKRKRAERNRGSQKHQKDSVKLFKVAFRVGESTCFLE